MTSHFSPMHFGLIIAILVPHATSAEAEWFPRLSTPQLYSSADTILNACLGVPITFMCEFDEEHEDEIIEGFAFVMANDNPIYAARREWENRTISITYNATTLNVTHLITNFTCGTQISLSSAVSVWASKSNMIRIKFHKCEQHQRRMHRALAGRTVKLVCPFYRYHARSIDWDLDGFQLIDQSNDKYKLNAHGSSLTIKNLTREDSGVYRCFHKSHPLVLNAISMSHHLTIMSQREELIPDSFMVREVTESSALITWKIELENRVGIKRLVDHTAPFVICYASLTDEVVKNMTVSVRIHSVRILAMSPGTFYAIQVIKGTSELCFGTQDNMQMFTTLSPGERWETGEKARMEGREARAVDIVEGEKKILYCGANLENLTRSMNYSVAWYQDRTVSIVSKPNGRRTVDPRTGALIFSRVYEIDHSSYRCRITFHECSGLIKGDGSIDQWVFLTPSGTGDWTSDDFDTPVRFKCSNSTESSITIEGRGQSSDESEWREDGFSRPPIESSPRRRNTFTIRYWINDGMGHEEAPDVLQAANSTTAASRIVLENLITDTLYVIEITEANERAKRKYPLLQCWTDMIQDDALE